MWLMVSFDIPSENGKEYRNFRKVLLQQGFEFMQKSFAVRWIDTAWRRESICNTIQKELPPGKLLFFQISDREFSLTSSWLDCKKTSLPHPKDPWLII